MFIAQGYAALGQRDVGLEVLNAWIRYYQQAREITTATAIPKWYLHRAVIEYGAIAEADTAFPTTRAKRRFLEATVKLIRDEWPQSVTCIAEKCEPQLSSLVPLERGATARLLLLHTNLVGRWLRAVVATRSSDPDEWLTPDHRNHAEHLVRSGGWALDGERPSSRQARQSTALADGSVALLRWIDDGTRRRILDAADAKKLRESAYAALRTALPQFRRLELAENDQAREGNYRHRDNIWLAYRLDTERELLDLLAQDGK